MCMFADLVTQSFTRAEGAYTTAPRGKSDTYPTSHAVAAAAARSVSRKVSAGWAPMSRSVCGPQRSTEVQFRLGDRRRTAR